MPAPKKRQSKSKTGRRRSHIKVEEEELTECPQCGESKRPHTVCSNCGYYKGEQVISQETSDQESTQEEKQEQKEQKEGLSWEGLSQS